MTGSVVCLATGSYLEEWKDCIETQQRYCETFGYDYHLLDKDISALHPKWQKFERSEALLREGRHVLLIDADAAILPAAPPFESVLQENPFHDIFAVLGRSIRDREGLRAPEPTSWDDESCQQGDLARGRQSILPCLS